MSRFNMNWKYLAQKKTMFYLFLCILLTLFCDSKQQQEFCTRILDAATDVVCAEMLPLGEAQDVWCENGVTMHQSLLGYPNISLPAVKDQSR